jgi:DNA-binding response OmpR family regulator
MHNILVVDDDLEIRSALVKVFSKEGYCVVSAADGDEAVDHARRVRFALIVADLRMPNLGGLELLCRLKESCPETAVIILTALGDSQTRSEILMNGAFDCVSKPVKKEALLGLARLALGTEAG